MKGGGGLKFDKKKYCKGVEGPAPGEIFAFQRDVGHCFSLSRLYHQIISKPLNKVMKGLNPPTPQPQPLGSATVLAYRSPTFRPYDPAYAVA